MHLVKLRKNTDCDGYMLDLCSKPTVISHFLNSRRNGCGGSFDGQKAISNDLIFFFTISGNLSLRLRPLLLLSLSLSALSVIVHVPTKQKNL